MTVDKMPLDEMTADKKSLDEMTVDELACCHKKLGRSYGGKLPFVDKAKIESKLT